MSGDIDSTHWSVTKTLELFDVARDDEGRFVALTGMDADEERQVVEGTQVLAQAVFTILADVPSADVIRHHAPRAAVAGPEDAHPSHMPMEGRDIRLVDVVDVNSPDEVGPPELHAWVHYDPVPTRDDLAKALIAHFTGHLSISTTMRAHHGIGTSQAHYTVSTAPMTVTVSFHEPVDWEGWLLYTHESTQVGAGMSYVRGQVHTEQGELIASFVQEGLIRPMRQQDTTIEVRSRI
jgi:acyl-CoA thioesterase II